MKPSSMLVTLLLISIYPTLSLSLISADGLSNAWGVRHSQRHRYTHLRVGTKTDSNSKIIEEQTVSEPQHLCQFCSEKFASRNALFRHLRNSEACASKTNGGSDLSPFKLQRNDVLLSIAYDNFHVSATTTHSALASEKNSECSIHDDNENKEIVVRKENYPSDSDAKIIGEAVKDAFQYALNALYNSKTYNEDLIPKVIRSTQTSVANHRHHSLSQENGVGSSGGEVMSLSYLYPVRRTLANEKKAFRDAEKDRVLGEILKYADNYLISKKIHVRKECIMELSDESNSSSSVISDIDILSAKNIPSDAKMHAEMSCTQRVYHYLLPLRWLDGGKEVESWWLENRKDVEKKSNSNRHRSSMGERRAKIPPPNQMLRKLKDALRSAECRRVSKRVREESVGTDNNIAKGRFGVLAMKPRRAWHNFADPLLQGDASPSNKPVWRVLDRCRIVQFVPFQRDPDEDDIEVMLVIQFIGDDFLLQQARRIIGSAIAITNEWLPKDFIQTSTRSDICLETPLAPCNRMYFSDSRFHFDELKADGKRLFADCDEAIIDTSDGGTLNSKRKNPADVMLHLQSKIATRNNAPSIQKEETSWLSELQHEICPRITKQIDRINADVGESSTIYGLKEIPPVYSESLSLLREIAASGRWPSTSIARSKVIKKDDAIANTDHGSNDHSRSDRIESGSFTVINPKFQGGAFIKNKQMRIPMGNDKFPDLVDTIFSLELKLSQDPQSGACNRPPSSHCAVNRNAQFTPHVDSGRGAGQSLSMICGLGDYVGGELMIEGRQTDIRYVAKEFDGWKQRHWTSQFTGERYSLVFFTPEM